MPGLTRTLSVFSSTNIVVANMIGAGIFTTSGLLLAELHSPTLMILLWVVGGVLAFCGALSYSELGAAMPEAGGEYVYLSRLYHPIWGFLSGWVSFFVGFSAPLAASALGLSEYLALAFPELLGGSHTVLLKRSLAIVVIAALTLVHLRGLEFGARVQNALTIGKVVLIAGFILIGFALGRGNLGHLALGESLSLGPGGWKTIGLSLMWIMFGYSGWNASAYLGSEIRHPERNLPRSLLAGTLVVMLLYFGLNLLFVYAVAPQEMSGVIAVGGLTAARLFGTSAEILVSVLIAFALLSSLSALIIIGPRVYYAMARDGYFFPFAADVHPLRRVPTKSILLQCSIAVVMVLSGTFDQILTYMGFCLGIFPILAVLGVMKLRRSGAGAYRMPAYPLAPIVFVGVSVLILILAYVERPTESSIALATVALGVPFFFFFNRSKRDTAVY